MCVREKTVRWNTVGVFFFFSCVSLFLSLFSFSPFSRFAGSFFSFTDFVHETSRLSLRLLSDWQSSVCVCVRASAVRAVCLRAVCAVCEWVTRKTRFSSCRGVSLFCCFISSYFDSSSCAPFSGVIHPKSEELNTTRTNKGINRTLRISSADWPSSCRPN